MKFFDSCNSHEEAKKVFRRLSQCFHPDKGGDPELMIELNKQYNEFNPATPQQPTFQAFGGGYQFNTIRRDIPFDHEIHSEIRSLKNTIALLNSDIRKYIIEKTLLQDSISALKRENTVLRSRILDFNTLKEQLDKQYKEQCDKIASLEYARRNTWWNKLIKGYV